MYSNQHDAITSMVYLVFAIGCLIFFLFGVFALCCCCRKQFRGIERKGFVIGETAPTQPPSPVYNPAAISGVSPGQIQQISPVSAPLQVPQFSPVGAPPHVPPPYDLPPKQ